MLEQVQNYLETEAKKWNDFENRVDPSYEIKTKTYFDNEQVFLYKVGKTYRDQEEPTWNFLTGVQLKDDKYTIYFFLDVEEEIIDSLHNEGYPYHPNHWMKEYEIEVDTWEDVKRIYEQHVWRFDPGHFY